MFKVVVQILKDYIKIVKAVSTQKITSVSLLGFLSKESGHATLELTVPVAQLDRATAF